MPLFEALGLKHLGDVGEEKELEEDGDLESLTFSARSSAGDDSGDDELESLAAFSEHPDAELDGDEDIDSEGDAELPRDAVDGADGDTVPEAEAARDPADEGEPELWAKAAGAPPFASFFALLGGSFFRAPPSPPRQSRLATGALLRDPLGRRLRGQQTPRSAKRITGIEAAWAAPRSCAAERPLPPRACVHDCGD